MADVRPQVFWFQVCCYLCHSYLSSAICDSFFSFFVMTFLDNLILFQKDKFSVEIKIEKWAEYRVKLDLFHLFWKYLKFVQTLLSSFFWYLNYTQGNLKNSGDLGLFYFWKWILMFYLCVCFVPGFTSSPCKFSSSLEFSTEWKYRKGSDLSGLEAGWQT